MAACMRGGTQGTAGIIRVSGKKCRKEFNREAAHPSARPARGRSARQGRAATGAAATNGMIFQGGIPVPSTMPLRASLRNEAGFPRTSMLYQHLTSS